jgi:hypothetical protein
MSSSWRDIARPIIERVLRETQGQDAKAILAALQEAYPFGVKANHPYRIWLSEIQRQRSGTGDKRFGRKRKTEPVAVGQLGLFESEAEAK